MIQFLLIIHQSVCHLPVRLNLGLFLPYQSLKAGTLYHQCLPIRATWKLHLRLLVLSYAFSPRR